MKPYIWFVPAVCVFLGILLLSTAFSVPIQVEGVGYLDKIQHAFAYFVLVLTVMFGFYKTGLLRKNFWLVIILAASVYGVSLEWVQYTFFPDRYFEWMDALANVSGAFVGGVAFRVIRQ